jgi:UDP-glucose 4-epimerase
MKVLVTGGAGFIGRHLVEYLQDKAEVRVIDNFRSGSRDNLNGLKCELMVGSILDRNLMRRALNGVDYVFHLAAMVSVPESIEKSVECVEINSTGTLILLEEAVRASTKKFVFSSSAAIYGDTPVIPTTEDTPPQPRSPYASSKLEAEGLCNRFTDEGHIQTVCLRYFNVFGPYQNLASNYAAAVPTFIQCAVENRVITVFSDGLQTRDFIHVKDVAAANAFFATESPATGTFNVACGHGITINQLAETVCRLTKSSSPIRHDAERPGDVRHSVAVVDKSRKAGFSPTCDFEMALCDTIDFFMRKAGMSRRSG